MQKKWKISEKCGKFKWIFGLSLCLWISGCAGSDLEIEDKNETEAEISEAVTEEETLNVLWTKEEISIEIDFLESNFGDGTEYHDMDEGQIFSYVNEIKDGFEFSGRVSDDGYGYILAFQKYEDSIFEGYDHYWVDHDYVVVEQDEETDEESEVYRLTNVSTLYSDEAHEFMWIQPEDLEEPRELAEAFIEYHCNGEEGRSYLESVMNRKVRFTPPVTDEGYIAVYQYVNGKQRLEHIVLTPEEEKAIFNSDALILPEWYGKYGLQYYVSQEIFDEYEDEEGPITAEALKIAKERCGYVAEDISEIRDIIGASLTMRISGIFEEQEDFCLEITDENILKELEEIYSSAEVYNEGKCPYRGILTLTREDGKELILSLAIDSCDGFVFGSNGFYTVGKEKTKRVWEIFEEARPFTGWDMEE